MLLSCSLVTQKLKEHPNFEIIGLPYLVEIGQKSKVTGRKMAWQNSTVNGIRAKRLIA